MTWASESGIIFSVQQIRRSCAGRKVAPIFSPFLLAVIEDGLSHTVLFGESLIGDADPTRYTPWTDTYYYQGNLCTEDGTRQICQAHAKPQLPHDSYRGTTWLFGNWRHTWYNHILGPNSKIPDCSAGGENMHGGGHGSYSARSYHSGGVNVVFCDSRTQFISESIDLDVWRALSSRNGKEVLSDF